MKNDYPLIAFGREKFQEYENECSLVLWNWQCHMGCPWCSIKNILNKEDNILDIDYMNLITNHTELETAVVFLGGEPMENFEGLKIGLQYAKKLGLKTKIFTTFPYMVNLSNLLINNLLDAVSIDFKTPMKDKNDFLWNSVAIDYVIDSFATLELRTTLHPGLTEADLITMERQIKELKEQRNILSPEYKNNDFKWIKQRYITPTKG